MRLVQWTSEYYACGAGEALAAAMPPRAWIESERHAQITAEGVARSATESGARGEILQALNHGKPKRLDSIVRRSGSYAAIAALERDGLVIVTRPLQGKTSAFRTVRVATLTAQGHDMSVEADSVGLQAG